MKNRRFPYGYEMRDGEIVICQTEADVVRTIFRDYIDGKGLKDIAEKLTALKVEYLPGESNWNKSRIKRMIEDKRYLGDSAYPQILQESVLQEANTIKSNRCTTDNCVVHSENKEVIYTVRCAECGDRLIHRTDNSRKNTESWYCQNKDCKTVVRKTVAVLEDEITELLNSVIQNPDLAGKEYISPKDETPVEIKRMENEIELWLRFCGERQDRM